MAALAASQWTLWCLHAYCVQMSDVFVESPANQLDLDPLSPGWGGCVSTIGWCGIEDKDDNEKKWEVVRNI